MCMHLLISCHLAAADVAKRGDSTRKDANPAHVVAFRRGAIEGKKRYFGSVYGDRIMHLRTLGTHPDYRRHGYGTELCDWGLSKAKDDDVVVSVTAGPIGLPLYTHLRFKDLGRIVIQLPGEEESVGFHAMLWNPKDGENDQLPLKELL
jgi:GNAT superfamily N-acetyltransferase